MSAPLLPHHQRVCDILTEYATTEATLKAAIATHEAQIVSIRAAIDTASAEAQAKLKALKAEAEQLGKEHPAEVFGDVSTLIVNTKKLSIRPSEAVVLLDKEDEICRRLHKDLQEAKQPMERLALSSLLKIELSVNKSYALNNYEHAPEWFEYYGVSIEERVNVSLTDAPPPKAPKAKKLKAAPAPVESEAA